MIRNPEYFAAIVEAGSLTKAAKRLYVSQPYLSQYLKQLEQNLNIELFDHSASPLVPTYAGQLFYQYVLRQIHQEENFKNMLNDLKNDEAGHIKIGMPSWRASCTLPVIYPEFHTRYPKIQVTLTEASPASLTEGLAVGTLDLAIMNEGSIPGDYLYKNVDYEILSDEMFMFAVPREHPAVKKYLSQNPSNRPSPIVLLKSIPLVTARTAKALPAVIHQLTAELHIKPDRILETDNFTTAVNLVTTGLACTFTMEGETLIPGRSDHVLYFPINVDTEKHSIVAVYRKDAYLSKPIRLFIDTGKECFARARDLLPSASTISHISAAASLD